MGCMNMCYFVIIVLVFVIVFVTTYFQSICDLIQCLNVLVGKIYNIFNLVQSEEP